MMPEIDATAVERRAKALAEQDGFAWQIEFKPLVRGAPIMPDRWLNEDRRKAYIERARAELEREAGNA